MASGARPQPPTILVVDDEPLLRLHAVDLIEEAGFAVVEACNADEAIAILAGRADIRIIFTDIDMPGSMDGLKLAAAVRDRWPPVEIIITSGQVTPAAHLIPDRGRFFTKPYDDVSLIDALRSFLA